MAEQKRNENEKELTPREQYAQLRERLRDDTSFSAEEIAEIDKAYALAEEMHSAQLRFPGSRISFIRSPWRTSLWTSVWTRPPLRRRCCTTR